MKDSVLQEILTFRGIQINKAGIGHWRHNEVRMLTESHFQEAHILDPWAGGRGRSKLDRVYVV